jgi:hypothetical protein
MVAVRLAQMKDTDFRRRHYEILRELQQAGLLGAMAVGGPGFGVAQLQVAP